MTREPFHAFGPGCARIMPHATGASAPVARASVAGRVPKSWDGPRSVARSADRPGTRVRRAGQPGEVERHHGSVRDDSDRVSALRETPVEGGIKSVERLDRGFVAEHPLSRIREEVLQLAGALRAASPTDADAIVLPESRLEFYAHADSLGDDPCRMHGLAFLARDQPHGLEGRDVVGGVGRQSLPIVIERPLSVVRAVGDERC